MNRQDGKHHIEWTNIPRPQPNGSYTLMPGWTWNPTAGCFHACVWPFAKDKAPAPCYAKTLAESPSLRKSYPEGFEHHYFHESRLPAPLKVKQPGGIFIASMGDIYGAWVPREHFDAVFDIVDQAYWHLFLTLTKNPYRVKEFEVPDNVWTGVSSPAGNRTVEYAGRQLARTMDEMMTWERPVRFMSFEPLWFDCASYLQAWMSHRQESKLPIEWALIGATSKGRRLHQPDANWTQNLLDLLDGQGIPVFFKGNLQWAEHRADFPDNISAYPRLPIVQKAMF